jgi:hypothetical protein
MYKEQQSVKNIMVAASAMLGLRSWVDKWGVFLIFLDLQVD